MTTDDGDAGLSPRLQRILMTEEAIYGLILVSGMVVVTGSGDGASRDVLIAVFVTVLIFFAAHFYAGTLARMAATAGKAGLRASLRASARQSSGLLIASVAPMLVLLLGATEVVDDSRAIWGALIVNTLVLGALGWIAVARWSTHWSARILGAVLTASFGGVLILLKAVISH